MLVWQPISLIQALLDWEHSGRCCDELMKTWIREAWEGAEGLVTRVPLHGRSQVDISTCGSPE